MLLREVSYARPGTVEEAIALLAEHDGARALAGGQTLLNVMKQRAASPEVLVDLGRLGALQTVSVSGSSLEIGAMTTLTSLIRSSEVEVTRPILAEVAAPGVNPSIQSPPLGFKPKVTGPEYVNEFTRHVIRTVAHMIQLEKRTGRTVTLALEPEPACFLETTEEAVDYFKNHLYAAEAVRMIVTETGLNKSQAEAALRKHLGMVYDICHQAVEYEDIGGSLRKLADNGIPVFKLQEAAALRVPNVTRETVEAMRPFASGAYVNFMSDEPGEAVRAAYGPHKYERLVALKRRYDPENVFRHNQNIAP